MRSSLLLLFPVVLRITGVAAFSPVKQRNNNRQCQSSVCGSEVSRYLTAHGSTFGLHAATYVVAVERNPDKARLVCSEEVDAFLISLEANGANENA